MPFKKEIKGYFMELKCSVRTSPTLVVLGTKRTAFACGSEAPARSAVGKALQLLLAQQTFLRYARVAFRYSRLLNSKTRLHHLKTLPKSTHEPLEETSALTLHEGNDPEENSEERSEAVCWTEVQFYSPCVTVLTLRWDRR